MFFLICPREFDPALFLGFKLGKVLVSVAEYLGWDGVDGIEDGEVTGQHEERRHLVASKRKYGKWMGESRKQIEEKRKLHALNRWMNDCEKLHVSEIDST